MRIFSFLGVIHDVAITLFLDLRTFGKSLEKT